MTFRSSSLPASGRELLVSETFVSVQGEGVSVGVPAAFLRLGNCNLRCGFCDTAYTWDEERYDLSQELTPQSIPALAGWVESEAPGRLIITGGEPLLQQKQLADLLEMVDRNRAGLFVEVETNGTVTPLAALLSRVNQWNVSPKLSNSGESKERRFKERTLRVFLDLPHAYFKFVVSSSHDMEELDEWCAGLGLPSERVLLMPQAADVEQLRQRAPQVAAWALSRRARYSGRLHLELFGGRRGT